MYDAGAGKERPHTHYLQFLDLLLDCIGILLQNPHLAHLLPLLFVLLPPHRRKTNELTFQGNPSPQTPTMREKKTNQSANPNAKPTSESGAFLTRLSSFFRSSLRYASVGFMTFPPFVVFMMKTPAVAPPND
jgi:hypothetical protein